ncbi:PP2C family serine/threonine-protein phosphatase [Helicobacter cetorum]|uniref:PP2C family serine/threonine-protein phosphatase n=1 Tax=Helicobacter cetorum TaxID=138563 RepID=UPI000CF149A4|nr:PP2C family serine/threonine-protein phosphatase [Helicobacter cetorum]
MKCDNFSTAIQGRGHIKDNIVCQDKVYSLTKNNVSAIALSDGAGSARLSHFGANCVTQNICAYLCEHFNELYNNDDGLKIKQDVLDFLLEKLDTEQEKLNCEKKDLSCTLLFVAICDNRFIIGHIGDGVISYINKDKEFKAISCEDKEGEANLTIFVTSKYALNDMRLFKGELKGILGFVLFSDGSQVSLYNRHKNIFAKSLDNIFKFYEKYGSYKKGRKKLRELLKNYCLNTLRKNTSDDCSINFLFVRQEQEFKQVLSLKERLEIFKKCKKLEPTLKRMHKAIKNNSPLYYQKLLKEINENNATHLSKKQMLEINKPNKELELISKRMQKVANNNCPHCALKFLKEMTKNYNE